MGHRSGAGQGWMGLRHGIQWQQQQRKLESHLWSCAVTRGLVNWGTEVRRNPAVHKRSLENLWRQLLSDPSQWWDHRPDKVNARYPDFKHKRTNEALWLDSRFNPPWVKSELAALPLGAVQSNFFSWNSRLARHVKAKEYENTMRLFQEMQHEGFVPDKFTFISVLNSCASLRALDEGKRIHAQLLQSGCQLDAFVGSSLVNMYAKCGNIEEAWKVFSQMLVRDVVAWNAMILAYAKCGQGQKALELSGQMQLEGVEPDPVTFLGMLNACASEGTLEDGRRIHRQIIQKGCDSRIFVRNCLIDMYVKRGSIEDAWSVFSEMPKRDVVGWNSIILGYVKCGQGEKALELSHQMLREGVEPVPVSFVAFLNACASVSDLDEGRRVHKQIVQRGCESDVYVASSLVDMYAKCGSIEDAWDVFAKIPTKNVVSWNAMITGYVKSGQAQKALDLYHQMQQDGVLPVSGTFVGVLKACAILGDLENCKSVHAHIIQSGLESHMFVGNGLVDMFAKCGSIQDAWNVFKSLPRQDAIGWNSMIFGYVRSGQGQEALDLYRDMQAEGVEPVPVTFVGLLNACASMAALDEGRRVHKKIIEHGFESDQFVSNSLVDMYSKCDSLEDALEVFNGMAEHNVVAWNTIILGCVKCGQGQMALDLCHDMEKQSVKPVPATFVAMLNACASVGALDEGRRFHDQITESGCESNVFVSNSLVDMYIKCGRIEDAWKVFSTVAVHDKVAWNAIILGYVRCGQGQKALELSRQMQMEGVEPDHFSLVGLLNACASVSALEEGRRVHQQIMERGWESDVFVGSGLVDMYAKCGSLADAREVFDRLPVGNAAAWNAMLGGYAMHCHANEALGHFESMAEAGLEMDEITFVSLLSACNHAGLVDEGVHFFNSMNSTYGISATVQHHACMVDIFGRAGRVHEAEDLIKTMSCEPDAAVWMSLLSACQLHNNFDMGKQIAKKLLEFHPEKSSGYVLLSNIYGAAGDWDRRADVQRQRLERGVWKQPGRTWIEVNNEVHSFTVDDREHPQVTEIHAELKRLYNQIEDAGYEPDTSFVLHNVEEEDKLSFLGHHSEKLAIAYGLISTPPGTPLRIFKNLRVCGDCHMVTKFISKVVGRPIIVRDANRFHHFENGFCSCREFW